MSAIPDSDDSPLVLTTSIFPDWSEGVRNFTIWTGGQNQTRANLEQRISHSATAQKAMEITVAGLNQAQAENLFSTMENRGRGPLLVPWFPEGLRLSSSIAAAAGTAQAESAPLPDWLKGNAGSVLIGTHRRTVTSIVDRVLTFEADGSAPAVPAGTWIFPMRLAALDRPDDSLTIIRHDASRQNLRFIALTK
jgi:hypothetical protein